MKILLGSKNPSKEKAVSNALNSLGFVDFEIESFSVESNVPSKPIGYEIIRGIDNRNQQMLSIASANNIDFDYLCSIEGGFELDPCGEYYVITYCGIVDREGNVFYGKSQGFPITKSMFRYLSEGHSLNKLIEEITNVSKNKQKLGITGYLSNGLFIRDLVDSGAVSSAFTQVVFKDKYQELETYLLKKKNNK